MPNIHPNKSVWIRTSCTLSPFCIFFNSLEPTNFSFAFCDEFISMLRRNFDPAFDFSLQMILVFCYLIISLLNTYLKVTKNIQFEVMLKRSDILLYHTIHICPWSQPMKLYCSYSRLQLRIIKKQAYWLHLLYLFKGKGNVYFHNNFQFQHCLKNIWQLI